MHDNLKRLPSYRVVPVLPPSNVPTPWEIARDELFEEFGRQILESPGYLRQLRKRHEKNTRKDRLREYPN